MALTSRISLKGSEPSGPEDYLSTSLGPGVRVAAPAAATAPGPGRPGGRDGPPAVQSLPVEREPVAGRAGGEDTLGVPDADQGDGGDEAGVGLGEGVSFDVRGKAIVELGAGTALPSMMAGLLGAERVVVTDYPAPTVIQTLRENIARNIQPSLAPTGGEQAVTPPAKVLVTGHSWGELPADDAFLAANRHAFDRVFVADCLWMPWQHENLHRSIDHFLRRRPGGGNNDNDDDDGSSAAAAAAAAARCWVVAGFHTGREKMRGFFEDAALARAGLEVERIWERDCDGREREWSWDREDDVTVRKRWLVIAVLKRKDTT
ncbi:hypothetical protein ACCO45_010736 [Purpureocillium lilacinum]|uniref:Uncharacterized protein n=1 Tax=Purpureocillium lilacinum TaxID=33203 RepID=A0ACC4DGK8_PURLI